MSLVYILGGYGTLAGINIVNNMIGHYNKIKNIETDGDHINFILDSCPLNSLHDDIISCSKSLDKSLERVKALNKHIILGVGCNTMHLCLQKLKLENNIKLISMIEHTCKKVKEIYNNEKIYLLSTNETYYNNIYHDELKKYNLFLEKNSSDINNCIKNIYVNVKKCIINNNKNFDLIINSISPNSIIILGCSELPLVKKFFETKSNIKIVDCNQELGIALANEYFKENL